MNDLDKNAHLKPDFDNAEYIIFIGMSPAQAGNPFKRQARQLANARTKGSLEYTIITPSLPAGSSSLAAGDNNRWVPIKPGTDSALVLGMIRQPSLPGRISLSWIFRTDTKPVWIAGDGTFRGGSAN